MSVPKESFELVAEDHALDLPGGSVKLFERSESLSEREVFNSLASGISARSEGEVISQKVILTWCDDVRREFAGMSYEIAGPKGQLVEGDSVGYSVADFVRSNAYVLMGTDTAKTGE